MNTLQLSLEKLRYEVRNLPQPEHTFPSPVQLVPTLAKQAKAHREQQQKTPGFQAREAWEVTKGRGEAVAPVAVPEFHPKNMIFCMSSVPRKTNYLVNTVRSLVSQMSDKERKENKIVVYNAMIPPSAHKEAESLKVQFAAEIEAGVLEVLDLFPPWRTPPLRPATAQALPSERLQTTQTVRTSCTNCPQTVHKLPQRWSRARQRSRSRMSLSMSDFFDSPRAIGSMTTVLKHRVLYH